MENSCNLCNPSQSVVLKDNPCNQSNLWSLSLYQPLVYGARLLGEVHSYYICMLSPSLTINVSERVGKELQLIVLVFYLLQGFLGGAVELEFHDVAVLRGLKEQVYAAVAGMVLRL